MACQCVSAIVLRMNSLITQWKRLIIFGCLTPNFDLSHLDPKHLSENSPRQLREPAVFCEADCQYGRSLSYLANRICLTSLPTWSGITSSMIFSGAREMYTYTASEQQRSRL